MEALERTNLFGLAQLPFDLEDILAVWEDLGSLDSRLSVLEHGLQRRLSPPLDGTGTLQLAKALDGARRLALAATLTSEGNIMMPRGAGVGLDTVTILPDWSEPERRELLERGVFSDAIYGMVRFRHRENRELLAAQALAQKLRSGRQEEIEGEIFRQVYGEAVIVPRMRPLLPWLILFDENVRKRTLALQPIIVTEGGDAARLPLDIRKKMLVDLVSNIATGESRGGDNGAIARIAQLDLADETLRLLEDHWDNDDVIFFLGRLAWQGKMVAPAMKLSPIVLDPARGIYARIVSARAVLAVGGPQACSELWSALNQSSKTLSRRLLAELVEGAPATTTSVAHLLRSLEATPSLKRYDTSGLSQAIHNFIDRLPITGDVVPERPLVGLLEGFAEFLRRSPHIERRECKVSKDFHWLMASAMHTVERLIVGRSSACFEPAAMSVLSQIPALRNERGIEDREYKSKLDALVPRWNALNDSLFWHTVANARAANAADAPAVDDDWAVSWLGHFWTFDSASFDRTLGWVTRCDIADDRLIALSRSFRTYAQNGRPRRWRRLLWQAVKGEPALEARLKMLMRPPASPARHR